MQIRVIPEHVLDELADLLGNSHLPIQKVIAKETDTDQPFVSRVRNREVKRVTKRVVRLWEYASSRVSEVERAAEAVVAVQNEIESPVESSRRKRSPPASAFDLVGDSNSYDEDAIDGIKAYIADGYDPRLIVEQLVVLRRAQKLRKPGRSNRKGQIEA